MTEITSSYVSYALLLVEDKNVENKKRLFTGPPIDLASRILPKIPTQNENLLGRITNLLIDQIKAHAESPDIQVCTAEKVIKETPAPLVPIMYRIASEDFVKSNTCLFKIIQCPNETKLQSDMKPSLADILIHLKHQVIVVELKNDFTLYNDFIYSILRQIDYDWKIRLPRSFFHPDDVCLVNGMEDRKLVVISPSMPDGDLEIPESVGTLAFVVLNTLKASCMGALENHLLMRDLRVGRFCDTLHGVAMIRLIYRSLQQCVRSGKEIKLGTDAEDLEQLMGDSPQRDILSSAQKLLDSCKSMGIPVTTEEGGSGDSIFSKQEDVLESKVEEKKELENKLTSIGDTLNDEKIQQQMIECANAAGDCEKIETPI